MMLHLAFEFATDGAFEAVVHKGDDHLGAAEEGVLLVNTAEVERNHGCGPSGEIDEVGLPSELAYRLEGATAEEEQSLVGISQHVVTVVEHALALDGVFLVVDEVDLHACCWDRSHLDDELVVAVVDDEVHAGEADDFMQLVLAVVYLAEFGHEDPDFASHFLRSCGQVASKDGFLVLGRERCNFLIYK